MASADVVAVPHRKIKRRRRRRQDKPAISARLVLDDHVKSDVGILSEDLFADLFPQLRDSQYPSSGAYNTSGKVLTYPPQMTARNSKQTFPT